MGKGFVEDNTHTPQQCIQFQAGRINALTGEIEELRADLKRVWALARLK